MSKLSAWMRKYEQPFTVRADNGKGTILVEFHDGYVTVVGMQPGHPRYQQKIHLTRSAWIQVLKAAVGPTRLMQGPDFDPYRAEREYYRQELEHAAALRLEKRQRRQGPPTDAQQRRYLRAKHRSQRRQADATE